MSYPTRWIAMMTLTSALAGCALATQNTETLLSQAGFRKLPADTPKRAEHLQTLAPHKIIRRTTDGKSYYVYADPSNCKCLYVGNESAYAAYKGLAAAQQAAYLQEEREQEAFEGVK